MTELVFATSNRNKLLEVSQKLGNKILLPGLTDIGCHEDIPETADTIEGNAVIKARYVYQHYHRDCFADDTGLEVSALGGRPGVLSARYAGENSDADQNIKKLLEEMNGCDDRSARFKTAICLIWKGKEYLFEGIADGKIIRERRGTAGFGYDPVFVPAGTSRTFAELDVLEKNILSHRGKAIDQLRQFLFRAINS